MKSFSKKLLMVYWVDYLNLNLFINFFFIKQFLFIFIMNSE